MPIQLRATSKKPKEVNFANLVTKSFDMGDVSLVKKFSRVNVSYKMEGTGPSNLTVKYSIDGNAFKNLSAEPNNDYAINSQLMKTNSVVKTAQFTLPKRTKGTSISIKLKYDNRTSTDAYNGIDGFELSDIGFTFRAIQRK